MKHRALIVGCGRMGAGRDHKSPWIYDHPSAYTRLKDRVEVVGFVDRVQARADWAAKQWAPEFGDIFAGDHVTAALDHLTPNIVSICTPPSDRAELFDAIATRPFVRGVWCEKPYGLTQVTPGLFTQVNFIRRFDQRHQAIAARRQNQPSKADLFVICAKDIHTTCHFTDLANFWQIDTDRLHYLDFHGPALYMLREEGDKPGRYAGWRDETFVGGGVETGFMEAALGNLLDAVDGTAELLSPAQNAIAAEQWADEILKGDT